jgi:ribosome-binding factor A
MPREVPRARRIAEQAQRVLAQLLLREVRDPRLKPMTVTHVRISPDLTHMWVMYTLLAGDSHDELQKEILQEAAGYLRGPLGRALKLRLAPQLHFAPDDRARHVDDAVAGTAPAAAGDDDLAHYDSDLDDQADDERP